MLMSLTCSTSHIAPGPPHCLAYVWTAPPPKEAAMCCQSQTRDWRGLTMQSSNCLPPPHLQHACTSSSLTLYKHLCKPSVVHTLPCPRGLVQGYATICPRSTRVRKLLHSKLSRLLACKEGSTGCHVISWTRLTANVADGLPERPMKLTTGKIGRRCFIRIRKHKAASQRANHFAL